jgi:ketosteroid isomerase-like protein
MSGVLSSDLRDMIERNHRAVDDFTRGNSKSLEDLYSRREDVTLGNPFGPFVRGFEAVAETMERAATVYRDGHATGFDTIATYETPDMACIVETERVEAKIGGRDEVTPVSLRCTSIFRREEGAWRLVHRHADPITAPRAADSVIQTL